MQINAFRAIAPKLYTTGNAIEVVGGPGIGKSSIMRDVAADLSADEPFGLVTYILSQMDPIDMRGFVFPMKAEDSKGELTARTTKPIIWPEKHNVEVFYRGSLVVRNGAVLDESYDGPLVPEKGILLLDEFAQSQQDMQKAAAQVILDKRIGEFTLPEDWVVWAAGNRSKDRSGVQKRLAFVRNRMCEVEIEPSFVGWQGWANKHGVHPLTITFAKRYPAHVFREEVPKEDGAFCTPRSLVLCSANLEDLRDSSHSEMHLPDGEAALEIAKGWLGEAVTVDFMSHIRIGNDLPEMEDVAKRPDTTPVPERPDAQFVMANMLAHHVSKDNANAFLDYMKRLGVEMQVLFIESATHRNPMILGLRDYQRWMSANQELSLAAIGA